MQTTQRKRASTHATEAWGRIGTILAFLLGSLPGAWAQTGTPGAAAAPKGVPDTLEQRVAACIACHAPKDGAGTSVGGVYFPRIAGKPAGYLYNQLLNFREGRRQYPLMTWMVNHLPDPYLLEIAEYFSTQHPPVPPPQPATVPPTVLERGQRLVRQGDPALKVPACVACHGANLAGIEPAIPGLLNLPRDYVNAQFGAWRNKVRRAHAPDCMATIAERLAPGDVAAISAWLATQPTPPDARPAARPAAQLPIACGSMP